MIKEKHYKRQTVLVRANRRGVSFPVAKTQNGRITDAIVIFSFIIDKTFIEVHRRIRKK